jgi:hypothetical protein
MSRYLLVHMFLLTYYQGLYRPWAVKEAFFSVDCIFFCNSIREAYCPNKWKNEKRSCQILKTEFIQIYQGWGNLIDLVWKYLE